MSGALNKVLLIGNLGKDPESTSMSNGNKVVKFSLATSDSWRDKQTGDRKEATEWHNVVIWNEKIGEIVLQYCKKGSKIYLEGKLKTRTWEKDGQKHWTTEVAVENFGGSLILLNSKEDGGGSSERSSGGDRANSRSETKGSSRVSPQTGTDPEDDIPFSPCFM